MGFDLHGLKPEKGTPKPQWAKGDPFIKIEANKYGEDYAKFIIDPQVKEEYDAYLKSMLDWNDNTEGAYFRNNVWFWRPLWGFVTGCCDDILTQTDRDEGHMNNGHRISKTKSKRIASRLRKYLKEGYVESYESWYAGDNSNKDYPFSIENVRNFERFCEKSGGFEIC